MASAERPVRASEQPDAPLYLLAAAGLVVGIPACLAGLALEPLTRRHRREAGLAALAGLALAALLWPAIRVQVAGAVDALIPESGLLVGGVDWAAAWPHLWRWWALTLPLAPAFAFLVVALRPKTVGEQREREQRRGERTRERQERRARRQLGAVEPRQDEPAAVLGRKVSGEAVLPVHRGELCLPLSRLERHLLVLGASGSGKTETLLRLAWAVAQASDWQVLFLDAKGDERTQRRFHALMRDAGREARLFPREPYDGWRGEAREITNRLVGLIDFATEGGATYYRDTATNIVRLATEAPGGPPRSAPELLSRLRRERLEALWSGRPEADDVAAYAPRQVDECRQRYQSFFRSAAGQLDGRWAFEDAGAGYLLLNELAYGEETAKLARFLVEDFKQYVAARKPRERRTLLIVDEFSGVAEGAPVARVVETVRSYGAAVVLAPQVAEGMGGAEAAARIIGSVGTVVLHQLPAPEELVRIAGTRLVVESSLQHDEGQATGLGSARTQHAFKVDPNEVRALQPGMCFVIGSGRAAKVAIARAPAVADAALPALPQPVEADPAPANVVSLRP